MANAVKDQQNSREGQDAGPLLSAGRPLLEPSRPQRRAKIWAASTAAMIIVLIGACAWALQSWPTLQTATTAQATVTPEGMIIVPQAVSQQLDIVGTISAGRSVAVVAPFDGVIRQQLVELGDHVNAGDILVVVDATEIASQYRDAQSAFIKAAMAVEAINKWEQNSDVLRARRSLETAKTRLASLERQVSELKTLLDQGIVSRNEYDGVVEQTNEQQNAVAGVQDDLAAVLARGNDDNRKLATLELENAQSRVNGLKQQMDRAKITTDVAGILTRPPATGNEHTQVSVQSGTRVTRGMALYAVADTSTFTLAGVVDEVDVNRVKIGQSVMITADAVPGMSIKGKVASVSAQADGAGIGGRAPSFEVRASFTADDSSLQQNLRIGMSARMTIETYSNPAALVVLPSAIFDDGSGPQVKVRRDDETRTVPVVVGATFPSGVEVLSGLSSGDRVIDAVSR